MLLAMGLAQALAQLKAAQAATVAARGALAAEGGVATADIADDWNPTGWVIDAGVGAAALYSLYQLHQASQALADAQAQLKEAQQEQAQAQAGSGSTTNVNTPGKDPCNLKPYEEKDCPKGEAAHHVIADSVLRYGTRGSDTRIPNAPSLEEGLTICLSKSEHQQVHAIMDKAIAKLGQSSATGAGTAPMDQIVEEAIKAIEQVKPECKGKFQKVRDQFEHMGDQPGRTTRNPPKAGSPAAGTLQSGGNGTGTR